MVEERKIILKEINKKSEVTKSTRVMKKSSACTWQGSLWCLLLVCFQSKQSSPKTPGIKITQVRWEGRPQNHGRPEWNSSHVRVWGGVGARKESWSNDFWRKAFLSLTWGDYLQQHSKRINNLKCHQRPEGTDVAIDKGTLSWETRLVYRQCPGYSQTHSD